MNKIVLKKEEHISINRLASDLVLLIKDLSILLHDIYNSFYNEECGINTKNVLGHLFDEWLYKNMNPKSLEISNIIEFEYKKDDGKLENNLNRLLSDFIQEDKIILEILVNKNRGKSYSEIKDEILYKIFANKIIAFIDQTSIQFVGRYLMLFVGIDKKAWNPITPKNNISNTYYRFNWIVRNQMYKIVPTIYNFNELDWIYIDDLQKQSLSTVELKELEKYESFLDKYLGRMYKILNKFDFSYVDSDIWKDVYQKILPKEEENRLGFVHTPDEIVDTMLDLVDYKETNNVLCKIKLLDPACGSGTFLINALSRLTSHLDKKMSCHEYSKPNLDWKIEEEKLDIIKNSLYGIDINPFATFLTTMNLVFILMDKFSKVKQKNPYYNLDFNILTNDSLAEVYDKPSLDFFQDPREAEAMRNLSKFTRMMKTEYDLVIGNPPWGTVLRGKLGPLGNEEKRKDYKKRFDSSTGKYDIYVLFMERGIDLLKKGGTLGYITQVNYVSQDYGDGIKEKIKKSGSLDIFVDLQTLGSELFPDWTNYPAITVFTKGKKQGPIQLMEVKKNE